MPRPTKDTKPPTDAYRCKACKSNYTRNAGKVCTKCLDRADQEKTTKKKPT